MTEWFCREHVLSIYFYHKHQVKRYHFSIVKIITESVSLIQMSKWNKKVITMMENN